MSEKLTSSWADEVDDVEPHPKPTGNAWAKGNPYGLSNANAAADSNRGNYEKDFPTVDDKRANERSYESRDNQDYGRRDRDDYAQPRREAGYGRDARDNYQPRDRDDGGYQRNQRNDYNRSRRDDDFSRDRRPEYNNRDRSDYNNRDRYESRDRPDYRPDYSNRDRPDYGRDRPDYRDRGDYYNRDNNSRSDYNRDRSDRPFRAPREPREPREPVPFPTTAPFTAFVGNLPFDVTQDEIYQFFESEPDVKIVSIRLLEQRDTGRLKGYGYVEFENLDSLKKAVARNGEELAGRPLKIDVAEAKPDDKSRDKSWGNRRAPFGGRDDRERDRDRDSRERDSGEPREEISPKERPKLDLKPRTVEAKSDAPAEAYKTKSNPFGNARPRDENAALQKIEEERKRRQEKEASQSKNEAQSAAPTKSSPPTTTSGNTGGKFNRDDREPRKEGDRFPAARREGDRQFKRDDNRDRKEGDRDSFRSQRGGGAFERPRGGASRGNGDRDRARRDFPRKEGENNTRVPGGRKYSVEEKEEAPKVANSNLFAALGEDDDDY